MGAQRDACKNLQIALEITVTIGVRAMMLSDLLLPRSLIAKPAHFDVAKLSGLPVQFTCCLS
jgi:hypothetical protein